VLEERLPKEVRLNGTCSSGADDDRNDRVLLHVDIVTVFKLSVYIICDSGNPSCFSLNIVVIQRKSGHS